MIDDYLKGFYWVSEPSCRQDITKWSPRRLTFGTA